MEAQVCGWYGFPSKKGCSSLPSERAAVGKLRISQAMITYIELLAGQRGELLDTQSANLPGPCRSTRYPSLPQQLMTTSHAYAGQAWGVDREASSFWEGWFPCQTLIYLVTLRICF